MTNFKLSALILAATTTLAAPAFANDALAESLGVEPGKYTNNQLIRLQAAMSSDDQIKVDAILAEVSPATSAADADSVPVAEGAIAQAEDNNEQAKVEGMVDQNTGEIGEISEEAAALQAEQCATAEASDDEGVTQ
jgi:predicted small secreted protein